MCNVVNKHSICNLAHCARYFQSLNHTVSRDCVHTLVLQHTDVYTNGFSRTHFVSCCKKQAELNVSASADILTNGAITGDDNVVCVFAHTQAPLNTWRSPPAKSVAPDVAALHCLAHLIYILLLQRLHIWAHPHTAHTWAHTRNCTYTHMSICMQRTHTPPH